MRTLTLVLLLVASTVLAGCTDGPADTPATQADTDPILHTSPDDGADLTAEESRNRSHLHDYWGDERTRLVIDDTFGMGCTYCGNGPAFRYEADAGGVIPQGTRWVNITLSWTESPESWAENHHLWIETAADHEPWDAGPIESGDTVQIEVTNDQNDLPHETLSNWAFEMHVESSIPGPYHLDGEATLVVEATRGNPLPVFPPHPDLWNGTDEIALLDIEDEAEPVYRGAGNGNTGIEWLGPYRPENGTVVPYDMDHVTVVVAYGDDAPTPFTLRFHGADAREYTDLEPDTVDGKTHTYVITSDMGRADGPYSQQSQWVFDVVTDGDGQAAFAGSFRMTATAHQGPA